MRAALALALSFATAAAAHAGPPKGRALGTPTSTWRVATTRYDQAKQRTWLEIHEIDAEGSVRTLGTHDDGNYQDLHWLDGHTLVASVMSDERWTLHRFVDGVPNGSPVGVSKEAFGAESGETAPFMTELAVDKKGGLWLTGCVKWDEELGVECKKSRWVPIDLAAGTVGPSTTKTPAGARVDRLEQRGVDLTKRPKLKAPAGYRVKLHRRDLPQENLMISTGRKVPSFTCTGPDGSITWPHSDVIDWEFKTRPAKAAWLSHNPPILWVTGPATSPIATTGPSQLFFHGCARQAMEDLMILGHDENGATVWMESESELDGVVVTGNHWTIHIGDKRIGAIKADTSPIATTSL